MKIEKLNLNTLKIILTVEELSLKDITIRDIESGKKKAQNFFFDIIENSNFASEFLQDNTKLLVEAYVNHDDKLIVTITKIHNKVSNLNGIGFLEIMTLSPSNIPLFITTLSFPKESIASLFPSGFGSST